jgi:hypothetical protein
LFLVPTGDVLLKGDVPLPACFNITLNQVCLNILSHASVGQQSSVLVPGVPAFGHVGIDFNR